MLTSDASGRDGQPDSRVTILGTGQKHCYDPLGRVIPCRGSRQDAAAGAGLAWPEPRFERRGERAFDRLTGLEWSREANPAQWPMPLVEAGRYLERLNRDRFLGRNDWRLPGRAELRSLTSFADRNPALPAGHPFTGVFLSWYWTSTKTARNPEYAWYVHMEGARTFFGHRDEDHLVWPCRGRSPVVPSHGSIDVAAAERFEQRDQTIFDHGTGRIWSRDADLASGPVTWQEGLDLVRRLDDDPRLPGSGWRLPTINELDSLVDLGRFEPALPLGHPFARVRDAYWSSTSSAYEPDWAMALYLDAGRVGVGRKDGRWFAVWAVREAARATVTSSGGGASGFGIDLPHLP